MKSKPKQDTGDKETDNNLKKRPVFPMGAPELFHNPRSVLRTVVIVAVYLFLFIILDLLSKEFEGLRGIVAWYPPAGLTYVLLLVFGVRYIPAVLAALLFSSLFSYHMPQSFLLLFLWALISSLIYGVVILVLRRRFRFDWHLQKMRDVVLLVIIVVFVSAILAVSTVLGSAISSNMQRSEVLRSIFLWWIGETVGVLTVAPFLLTHWSLWMKRFTERQQVKLATHRSFLRPKLSIIGQAFSIMLVFYLVFSVNVLTEFRPLYFIILPLIWIALDHGLKGVTIGIVVVNFGVMLAMWLVQFNQADIGELQLLMIVNCIIGLLMGAVVTEHKKTEEVLRTSENQFHTLFDQAAVGVAFIETRTGRYLDINQKYCDFLGYTKEEMRNSSFQMVTYPADVQESIEKTALLISGKINEFSIEKRFIRKDGSLVWANLTASPLWLPGIVPAEYVHIAVLLDITERKETEKALKRISNLLEQTGKMAKIGGWEFDVRTGDFFWSPETYRIHDVDPGVTPTKDLVQGFYAPEAKPTLFAMIQSAIEQGTTWEYELPIITARDRAIWIRGQGASIKEDGKTELLYGTYQDITERKKAEDNLHETKDYLDNLITYANAPIIIWDSEQKIRRFNLAFTHLTGYPTEEIIGKDLRILLPDETKAKSLVKIMQISERNQLVTVEVPILDNKGNTHIVLWNSANIYAKDGKTLVSTIAQGQDITDRKVAEAKILADQVELKKLIAEGELQLQVLLSVVEDQNLARQEIEKLNATLEKRVAERTSQLLTSNKELEAFAYSVSHDLRAPLRAIDGYSRILQQGYAKNLDDEGLRLLGIVRNSTKTMDQLITDLLSLSRVGRSELKYSTIDMNSLVSAIYQDIATPEVLKKFELKVSNLPNAPADPTLIRQVWVNLISNAIKYTMPKEKGIIEVDGSVQDGVCTYTIKDNGVGFNPEFKNKLFGMFQRLHKAEDFEGTGVGLAIVHRIILRHGGRVSGEGEIGNGATFTFSIPEKQVSNE